MALIEARPGKPFLRGDSRSEGDVSGIIGMAGRKVSGSMALVFPAPTILQIVSAMLGEEFKEINQDVLDCVGELTNMISGNARAGLAKLNLQFEMALPTMVRGTHHCVEHQSKGPVVCVPFELESGTFYVEAAFRIVS